MYHVSVQGVDVCVCVISVRLVRDCKFWQCTDVEIVMRFAINDLLEI